MLIRVFGFMSEDISFDLNLIDLNDTILFIG